LELPPTESLQARKRFLKKAAEFYLKEGKMFKRNGTQLPLLVIQNAKKKLAILTQAHENLGHRGEQAVYVRGTPLDLFPFFFLTLFLTLFHSLFIILLFLVHLLVALVVTVTVMVTVM
jgi:hypothetical protein